MGTELVHIGFGNIIAVNRVVALLSVNQQPIKRLIHEARGKGLLVDATHGRKSKAAILFDTGHITLAAVSPDTIAHRLNTASEPVEEKVEL
jgi:extracellular matrix regulatory protein A